ncbi:MAG: M1 family metallopeptidase [bacterium]|nr:M1 family metallopeptidase [bacterium]
MKKSVTRLYGDLRPSNYQLELKLDPEKMIFDGSVVIKARKNGRPSQRITLHQKDLKILSASIIRHDKRGDEVVPIDRMNAHKAYDELRLHSSKKLFPGDYTITIKFSGKITEPMNGLYPCHFTHDGIEKKLLATQFESHHAREVFPCIDEPEAKATFDLTLITPINGTVIANTPTIQQLKEKSLHRTQFETTPIMSTYLLAFVYGEVDFLESKTSRGTLVRTYATPENVQFTEFALETAVKCLEFYEDYFGIPYPLEKCDMIALPDFASGAMENWGLITYREQTLLYDPENTSVSTKQYVAMVVAHELAHQWFGNLVTMRWWTDLWLNEGFASWVEYLAVDQMFPHWHMWTQFIASEQQSAFKLDALENTHPIEVPINHPDEIRSIFDAISYNKGASVIHMLHGYLGAEDFKNGLRYYLQKHIYGNAATKDLWTALEHISGKPVSKFMQAWTSEPGFPLLSVSMKGDTVKLNQERFYVSKPEIISHNIWPIPILGPRDAPERLDAASTEYRTSADSGFFVKVNRGHSGFYRTLYSPKILSDLADNIMKLEPLDRLGILSDSFETAKAGFSSVVDSLKLLSAYKDEDNAAVWDIIAANIGEIRRAMDDEELREALKPYMRDLTATQVARLGWEEKKAEDYFDTLLRPTVIGLASVAENKDVVSECLRRFNKAKSPQDIPADLRSLIFNTAARHGDKKTFDILMRYHNDTNSSEERTTLAAALTSFDQPDLINKTLELVPTKIIRNQDVMYWIAYSFMNRHAKRTTWLWMKKNWDWLEKELGSDLSFFRTPIYTARSFSEDRFLKEYDEFFKPKSTPALERSIKQGREMLEWQIGWKNRDLKPLQKYLKSLKF